MPKKSSFWGWGVCLEVKCWMLQSIVSDFEGFFTLIVSPFKFFQYFIHYVQGVPKCQNFNCNSNYYIVSVHWIKRKLLSKDTNDLPFLKLWSKGVSAFPSLYSRF